MIETVIQAVRINVVNEQHVVLLKEVGGSRVIPIWIDPYQAHQIALHLGGREIARPMTHDLMNSIITEMGGVVERVIVLPYSWWQFIKVAISSAFICYQILTVCDYGFILWPHYWMNVIERRNNGSHSGRTRCS